MAKHRVDLTELEALADRLRGLVGFVDDALADVKTRVNVLHAPGADGSTAWSGAAAAAAATVFAEWETEAQQMRAGIAAIEEAGRSAHTAYSEGITAILATLGRAAPGSDRA